MCNRLYKDIKKCIKTTISKCKNCNVIQTPFKAFNAIASARSLKLPEYSKAAYVNKSGGNKSYNNQQKQGVHSF